MTDIMFTDSERTEILDDWLGEMMAAGWRIESRTALTAAVIKGTRMWAVLTTIFVLLPLAWLAGGALFYAGVPELLAVAATVGIIAVGVVWCVKARRRRVGRVTLDGRITLA